MPQSDCVKMYVYLDERIVPIMLIFLPCRLKNPASSNGTPVFADIYDTLEIPGRICQRLQKIGFGGFKVYIGENLSLENEKITYDYAKNLT